jgi:tRNA-2-methylthio-N6-dimethylallyladenosine synthase
VKLRRLQALQAQLDVHVREIGSSRVGTVQKVLVEGPSKKDGQELMARTQCNRVVNFAAGAQGGRLVGEMIDLKITQAFAHSLRGELLIQD